MTRKHFQLLANSFRSVKPDKDAVVSYQQWLTDVVNVANALTTTNPRFDKVKFIAWAKGEA